MNDKEGRKWLLQKLYDRGFKYIFHAGGLGGYIATKQQPETLDNHTYVGGSFERIDVLSDLIPDFNEPNYLDIGKCLGIVDWGKVAVDTPVKARVYNRTGALVWRNYHFAKYEKGNVYCWANGLTSWGVDNLYIGNPRTVIPFGVKLAGGNDEN